MNLLNRVVLILICVSFVATPAFAKRSKRKGCPVDPFVFHGKVYDMQSDKPLNRGQVVVFMGDWNVSFGQDKSLYTGQFAVQNQTTSEDSQARKDVFGRCSGNKFFTVFIQKDGYHSTYMTHNMKKMPLREQDGKLLVDLGKIYLEKISKKGQRRFSIQSQRTAPKTNRSQPVRTNVAKSTQSQTSSSGSWVPSVRSNTKKPLREKKYLQSGGLWTISQ